MEEHKWTSEVRSAKITFANFLGALYGFLCEYSLLVGRGTLWSLLFCSLEARQGESRLDDEQFEQLGKNRRHNRVLLKLFLFLEMV